MSCICTYCHYKNHGIMHVNKYWKRISAADYNTIVRFWCDSALKSKIKWVNMEYFHWSMSRWGNGEPENYTHIIPLHKYIFFCSSKTLLIWPSLEYVITYLVVVMAILVVVTTTNSQQLTLVWGLPALLTLDTMHAVAKSLLGKIWKY